MKACEFHDDLSVAPSFHPDGSVTFWCAFTRRWQTLTALRLSLAAGHMATMTPHERAQIERNAQREGTP